ncbi:MAG: rhodanese-like domain-containing protein, partial [Ferruginibacter sp.]
KIRNWALQYKEDQAGFVKYLLEDQPEPPKYFAMMKKLNKVNRSLLTSVPALKELTTEALQSAMAKGIKLIDTRLKNDFAQGFIPGSINIQGNNSFATWAGWFLKYDEPFILLANESQLDDLTRKLMRIGLDNIMGYIPSTAIFNATGGILEKAQLIDLQTTKNMMEDANVEIVDLRGAAEFNAGHIAHAKNVFVGTLPAHLHEVSKDKKVIIHCQGGDRAAIAYSILAKNGYKNVFNFSGGINEWVNSGEPVL